MVRVLGPAASLIVEPDSVVTATNGQKLDFKVLVTDVAGNTSPQPHLVVTCEVSLTQSSRLPF